ICATVHEQHWRAGEYTTGSYRRTRERFGSGGEKDELGYGCSDAKSGNRSGGRRGYTPAVIHRKRYRSRYSQAVLPPFRHGNDAAVDSAAGFASDRPSLHTARGGGRPRGIL